MCLQVWTLIFQYLEEKWSTKKKYPERESQLVTDYQVYSSPELK